MRSRSIVVTYLQCIHSHSHLLTKQQFIIFQWLKLQYIKIVASRGCKNLLFDTSRKSYIVGNVHVLIVRFTCIVVIIITFTNTTVVTTIAVIVEPEPTHKAGCGVAGEVEVSGADSTLWVSRKWHCLQGESFLW